MAKKLYKFTENCGRMGNLSSVFTADSSAVEGLYGKNVHFGEVLGKHSEISVEITEANFKVLSEDAEFISKFEEILGEGTVSGHNPLDYYEPETANTDEAKEQPQEAVQDAA